MMKSRLIIILFFSVFLLEANAQVKYSLPASPSTVSFREFVGLAESILPVRFYYREEWVTNIQVAPYGNATPLSDILERAFSGTTLHYYVNARGQVILTDNYAIKVSEAEQGPEDVFLPKAGDAFQVPDQQGTGNISVEIGNPADKNLPGKVILSGYVKNKTTKEPVAGVTVYIQKLSAGAISNDYGFYSIVIPRGAYPVRFSSIGMKERTINATVYGPGELNVDMSTGLIPLKEVVVSADKRVTMRRYEVGVEKINMTSFKLLPSSMGEPDIIRNILLLTGVQTVGEGATGFNVRGGSADQNLVLLYNAPVYNTSHFFGFFSAINSDLIKDVTLYKGGIPAKYGGRISSVLDVSTKDGNKEKFAGSAGISPIATHLTIEGPIIKNKLSIIAAARTTYSNWIFKLINDRAIRKSRAWFYDLNGKITWDADEKNKFELASYYSSDAFRLSSDTLFSYSNRILSFSWRHFYTTRLFSSVSVTNSDYRYNISSHQSMYDAFILSHRINSTGVKADVNWFQGKNEFNFGLDMTAYKVLPGTFMPYNDSSLVIPTRIEKEQAMEASLYAGDKFKVNDFLSLNVGIRLSSYFSFGPQSVMVYNPAISRSKYSIIDTLNYSSGRIISKYFGPEIRLSANITLSEMNSLKLNYNRTRQNLHLLTNSSSISPSDVWKLSDMYLKPETGDQVAAGFYQMLLNSRMEGSAEIYFKSMRNMIDFKGGTNLIMDDNIEKDIINMKGRAYGIELALKKTEGKLRFTLGYTYSRIFVKSLGKFPDEAINSGKWFPANHDKPNDLVITFNYLFSRRFSMSSTYTWSTGRPVTDPLSTYFFFGNVLVHYSDRNAFRIPDYSRLDLSFRIGGNLKSHRLAHPNWTFSVYNLLGRENVYSIYYKNVNDFVRGYKISVFAQAFPTITFSFDF